jgi:hypothetical protein
MSLPEKELLARAAKLNTFTVAKLGDGSVVIDNPLGLTQLVFTRVQWVRAVEFINEPTPLREES